MEEIRQPSHRQSSPDSEDDVEPPAVRGGASTWRSAPKRRSYAIGLRSSDITESKGFKEAEFALRQFAQETGGRAFFPNQVLDLAKIYGEISDELSSQYTVGYTSRNPRRDGGWRRVVIRVNGKQLTP